MTEDQTTEYSLLFGDDLKSAVVQTQAVELWVNNKVYSLNLAKVRVNKVVMAILHKPTNTVVGTVTGDARYSPYLKGTYYYLGVFILPNHGDRPKILERTFKLLRDLNRPCVKGVAVLRKNGKISDKLLKRFQFKPSLKLGLYFRDFSAAG